MRPFARLSDNILCVLWSYIQQGVDWTQKHNSVHACMRKKENMSRRDTKEKGKEARR